MSFSTTEISDREFYVKQRIMQQAFDLFEDEAETQRLILRCSKLAKNGYRLIKVQF